LLASPPALTQPGASDSTVKVLLFPEDRIHLPADTPPAEVGNGTVAADDTATVSAFGVRLDLLEPLLDDEIALLVESDPIPVIVRISQTVVIGRYSEHNAEQPHIDLVPYGAFEKGVSRFHALLRRHAPSDDAIFVEDLGSSNGTWLNGKRLQAHLLTRLHPGDYLRFGHLRMQAHFKAARVNA
jgi:hypothetical protein